MARQRQTQQVPIEDVQPGDMLLRGNGKYRRVLDNTATAAGERKIRYNPTGGDWFIAQTVVTIQHRDPKCACGCGESTRGGLWAPGHDGRMAGLGARALAGDREALVQVATTLDINALPTGQPEVEHNPEADCDASCQFAHRQLCVCSCGGSGHYMGWVRIGAIALHEVPEVLRPEQRRELATYVYTEGRRAYREANRVQTGPTGALERDDHPWYDSHVVVSPNYAEEDLDSWLRRIIPVATDADVAQGECSMSGVQVLTAEGERQVMVVCPVEKGGCGREVKTYSTGRMYRHHRPEVVSEGTR